jgi:hypothetical protein
MESLANAKSPARVKVPEPTCWAVAFGEAGGGPTCSGRLARHLFASVGTAGLFAAWGPSMVMRAASILVVVLGLSPGGMAGEHAGVRHRMSCTVVRYYVALYTASAAEQFARSKGATNADIEVARRCIKPEAAAQTASVQLER